MFDILKQKQNQVPDVEPQRSSRPALEFNRYVHQYVYVNGPYDIMAMLEY